MAQQTTTKKSPSVDPVEALAAMNDSTLKFVEDVRQRVLEVNKSAAEFMAGYVSALPSWWPAPETSAARGLLEQAFDFRTKLLEADQRFTLNVLDVWAPKRATTTAN